MMHVDTRRLLTGTALALLVAASSVLFAQQDLPRLVTEPTVIDFGRMEQQEVRKTTVTLRNDGTAPLKIDKVETSCGCTVATPDVDLLQPGQATSLEVTFNSKMFEGPQRKMIEIYTNDPRDRITQIQVLADVHAPLHIKPKSRGITFNRLPVGERMVQGIVVSTEDVPELEITPVHYREDLFTVNIQPKDGAGPATKLIQIGIRPDAPIGTIRELATFRTNVPGAETLSIEISGEIIAPVSIQPDKVNFRYVQRNQLLKRVFRVIVQPGHDIEVTRAEVDLPGFKVTKIDYVEKTRTYLVTVVGRPLSTRDERAIAADGRMKGTLHVHTSSPDYPELTASIMYMLRL